MCKCLEKIPARYKKKYPGYTDVRVSSLYHSALRLTCQYKHVTRNGRTTTKQEGGSIPFKFCPFCGVNFETEKITSQPKPPKIIVAVISYYDNFFQQARTQFDLNKYEVVKISSLEDTVGKIFNSYIEAAGAKYIEDYEKVKTSVLCRIVDYKFNS